MISLDAGFTLLYPFPKVGEVYAQIANRFGYRLDGEKIHARFLETWGKNVALNRQYGKGNAFSNEKTAYFWWKKVFSESVGDVIDPQYLDSIFQVCHEEYGRGKYWRLYPEVMETIDTLREMEFKLIILSNWDRRLIKTLKELGIYSCFDRVYISTLIGHSKPEPEAFQYILDDLEISAAQVLHVGDSLEEDYQGARGVGMKAVLLDREAGYDREIPGSTAIRSLTELL